MSSTRSRKRAIDLAVDAPTPPLSVGVASSSRRATLCTTIVYCWRSSSASAKRNGSRRCVQNSAMVQKNGATPVAAGADLRAWRWRRPAGAGRRCRRCGTAPAGRPSWRVAGPLGLVEAGVVVVEEEQVLALHVEDERLGVGRRRAEHARSGTASRAGTWRRWSWWPRPRRRRCSRGRRGCRRGTRGRGRRARRRATARRGPSAPSRRSSRARPRSSPVALRTAVPGSGGTNTSGSTRVVIDLGGPRHLGRAAAPPSMRNTSLSYWAPSWRARTCSTMPYSSTTLGRRAACARAPRRRRAGGTGRRRWRPRTRAAWRPRCR